MLVVLDVELCEEAGGTNGDEWRAVGVGPEEGGELVEGGLVEVVGDDEGEAADPVSALIRTEEVIDVLDDGLSLGGIAEFGEERDGFLSTRVADAFSRVEEEVVARVR